MQSGHHLLISPSYLLQRPFDIYIVYHRDSSWLASESSRTYTCSRGEGMGKQSFQEIWASVESCQGLKNEAVFALSAAAPSPVPPVLPLPPPLFPLLTIRSQLPEIFACVFECACLFKVALLCSVKKNHIFQSTCQASLHNASQSCDRDCACLVTGTTVVRSA